jgi:glucan-binding YG repeat protein
MISEAHKQQLQLKYGLPEALVRSLEESGEVCSLFPSEIRDHLGRTDIDSSGFLLKYPGNGAFTVRLDNPHQNGDAKPQKYLHRTGEPNYVFNPGVDLTQAGELWVVEGELKALCGHAQGLPIVGLSGVYNWRTSGPEAELLAEGEKLKDEVALLPELAQVDWGGKKINLLYDSDITPGHRAYDAFPRLAEQLYRLGAGEVRIISLPPVAQGQKTGLDEFILARGPEQALQDIQAIKDGLEPYLPRRDGGPAYAERLIKSQNPEDKLKAATAILGAKGKFVAGAWLKDKGLLQKDINLLLQEAKEKLAQLQAQAKPRASSSEAGGDLPELGPEYDEVKRLLKATGYTLDQRGRLCREDCKTKFDSKGNEHLIIINIPLCNFAAWPLREILKDNGASQERFIELQGLLQDVALLRPVKISLAEFLEKPTWAGLAWGAKAAIRPNEDKEIRYCIQQMAQEIPETVVYTHLGWREISGSWIYLHAGGAVGTGSESVEVEISERLRQYLLPGENGDIKEALKASIALLGLGPKKLMYPLLALVYLAPLCESLRQAGIEPSLLSYIWGVSGSKKSTLIALLLSHFGNFEHTGLPASFRDTANSIEKLAFLAKDTVLAVDDLYPAREPRERAKLEGVLEHLSRNQGDRTGKGRMKADTSLREGLPPRGLALCSGEIMPLSGSSLARNFVHKLQKGDIDLEKLTQAQAQKALLSQAMRGYLEWLAPQMGNLSGQLKEAFTHLRGEATEKATMKTRHSRLNEAISHLHLGLNSFLSFAVSQGALSQEEGEKILQEAWEIFNQIADEQALQEQAGEPSKKIAEASLELEAQRRIYWADMEDTPGFLEGAVKVGWKDEEKDIYYTNLGTLFKEVNQHLRGQGEFISLSKPDFISYLNQRELLPEKDKATGQNRDQKTIWIKDNSEEKKTRKTYAISGKFFREGEEDEE